MKKNFDIMSEEERLANIVWAKKGQEEIFKKMNEEDMKIKPTNMPFDLFLLFKLEKTINEEQEHINYIMTVDFDNLFEND